eukprot:m.268104 g.268104  ORF g.268104 m.268104 type:complete len:367 (-) comp11074_c2_seq11:1375-2475(-)
MRRHPRPCPKESAQWLLCMSFVLEEGNPLRDFLAWRQSCLKQARAAGTKVAHGPTLVLATASDPVFVGPALRKVGPATSFGRLGGHAHKHAAMLELLANRLLDLVDKMLRVDTVCLAPVIAHAQLGLDLNKQGLAVNAGRSWNPEKDICGWAASCGQDDHSLVLELVLLHIVRQLGGAGLTEGEHIVVRQRRLVFCLQHARVDGADPNPHLVDLVAEEGQDGAERQRQVWRIAHSNKRLQHAQLHAAHNRVLKRMCIGHADLAQVEFRQLLESCSVHLIAQAHGKDLGDTHVLHTVNLLKHHGQVARRIKHSLHGVLNLSCSDGKRDVKHVVHRQKVVVVHAVLQLIDSNVLRLELGLLGKRPCQS